MFISVHLTLRHTASHFVNMAVLPPRSAAQQCSVLTVCVCLGLVLAGATGVATEGPSAAAAEPPPCSLNGDLRNGACVCDKPWTGPNCSTMLFKPVSFPQGYGMYPRPWTVWGGNVLSDGSQYHLFASSMTNDCGLNTWTSNSRIDHAVADKIEGPYVFQDVAIPTRAHNAAPVRLPDGTFAIFHIFSGNGSPTGGHNCTNGTALPFGRPGSSARLPRATPAAAAAPDATSSTIHVSASLKGPWKALPPSTLEGCNNPAPWVHPNGSLLVVCRDGTLLHAESVRGPWVKTGRVTLAGGPDEKFEDPFMYTDKRGFHVLFHAFYKNEHPPHGHECVDSTVSYYAYSVDGFTWFASPDQPYTTQVELTNGTTITVATRERPKLFFNSSGHMTHLLNGACSAPNCPGGPTNGCVACKMVSWDYTLIQPLEV